MVLAADVFPSAGASAIFSNVVDHSIVVRRATVAGVGDAAKFKTGDDEYRFSCRFDMLEPGSDGKPIQSGTCTFPDSQVLRFVVNEERGASTADGVFRVFAGLRSDPFFLDWLVGPMQKVPNLLQHDNVLSIVIEFETRRVLDTGKGTLFGVVAETMPLPRPGAVVSHLPPRFNWIGKPEPVFVKIVAA